MAIQRQLGLLSERRTRLSAAYSADIGFNGSAFLSCAGRQSSKGTVVASYGLRKKRLEGCHQGSRGIGQELKR